MAIKTVYTNPKKIWILQLYIQIQKKWFLIFENINIKNKYLI